MNSTMEQIKKAWQKLLPDVDENACNDEGWVQIHCPIHGDKRASAGFNIESQSFNCFACGNYNIYQFIEEIYPNLKDKAEIDLLIKGLNAETEEAEATGMQYPTDDFNFFMDISDYAFSEEVMKDLGLFKIGKSDKELFSLPVMYKDLLMDVRTYYPDGKPKVRSVKGSKAGLIVGYNQWQAVNNKAKPVWICAGEKDMLSARSKGLNAITITGGELAKPKMYKSEFKDQLVYILYDNDNAGRKGASDLAEFLYECGANVKIADGFHAICKEDKEDIYDYFTKYNGTLEQLFNLTAEQPMFEPIGVVDKATTISIEEAIKPENNNKFLEAIIRVNSTNTTMQRVPKNIVFTKQASVSDKDVVPLGATFEYEMADKTEVLRLITTEQQMFGWVKKNARLSSDIGNSKITFLPPSEGGFSTDTREYYNVSKCWVSTHKGIDAVLDGNTFEAYKQPVDLPIYVVGEPLTANGVYKITFKVVSNPLNNQELVGVCTSSKDISEDVNKFSATGREIQSLRAFQVEENGSVEEKFKELYERFKGFAGNYIPFNLFVACELTYNSVLSIQYQGKVGRGNIITTIIGDSRTGKSETFTEAVKTYGKGKFASAKTASVVGLLGGSTQTRGEWRIKPGLMTREHGKIVILEETQGASEEYYKTTTDIKSSGTVRIARSDGDITFPTQLRLVEIANPKQSRELNTYPHGVDVIKELIDKPEDIARQDLYVMVPRGKQVNPKDKTGVQTPLSRTAYSTRLSWIWSKRANDIVWEEGAEDLVWDSCKPLNDIFGCDIQIFGSETYKKLARISVAVAASVISTDENLNKVIVKKAHVLYAVKLLKIIYAGKEFKLHQYAKKYNRTRVLTQESLDIARTYCVDHPGLIEKFALSGEPTTISNLELYDTYDRDKLKEIMSRLMVHNMVDNVQGKWIPTQKFKMSALKAQQELEDAEFEELF